MFRPLLAYVLIFTLLAGSFSRAFVYAGFEANQQFIAAKLCVNRSKPMLHCNGKCYLAKKLRQAEEKEKKAAEQSQKSQYQEAIMSDRFSLSERFSTAVDPVFPEITFVLSSRTSAIFHPPPVIG